MLSAGRRQKKKSRRAAALLTRPFETAALKIEAAVSLCPLQTTDDLLRLRRYLGGIAVSIFIYSNPPNALRSKKVTTHRQGISAMSMNYQYI